MYYVTSYLVLERWLACAGVDLATGLSEGASRSTSAASCTCNESLLATDGQSSSLTLDAGTTYTTISGLSPFTCYAFAVIPQNEYGEASDTNASLWLTLNTPPTGKYTV